MDRLILSKVKAKLVGCTEDTADSTKSHIMVLLTPEQADELYQYFIDIEPNYVKETCKLAVSRVIPQYNDYFNNPNDLRSIFDELSYMD